MLMRCKDTVNFTRTILTERELGADGQESCRKKKKRFFLDLLDTSQVSHKKDRKSQKWSQESFETVTDPKLKKHLTVHGTIQLVDFSYFCPRDNKFDKYGTKKKSLLLRLVI